MNYLSRIALVGLLAGPLSLPTATAQKTPNQILYGVSQKMNQVKDYTADANIRSEIPAIRILPVQAKVYFKQPDRFKVDSKGIVLLPKQGFSDFYKVIRDTTSYSAVIAGQEKIQQTTVQVINVIPAQDTADLILARLWVDAGNSLVLKSQLTTRSNGTMIIDYTYGRNFTFFEGKDQPVTHIDFTLPYSQQTRALLLQAAHNADEAIVDGSVYAATQGPRLETAAEINRLERDGADIVGMTGMPETALARELGLSYATLAVVANHAAGRGANVNAIPLKEIYAVLEQAMVRVRNILEHVVGCHGH